MYAKTRLQALQRCGEKLLKDRLGPDPDPGVGSRLAFCLADAKTAVKLSKAAAKLQAKIGKACGGADRVCGTTDDNLSMQDDVGFPLACPNFEASAEPDCVRSLAHCGDISLCLGCIHAFAIDQAFALCAGSATSGQNRALI